MAGYDGLALSLYDKNVLTFTDDGAHNFFSIVITDATTVTTGYTQAYYASITQTGPHSGGQISAFAADMTLGGVNASEVSGVYIYFSETGTYTSGGTIAGFTAYFAPFASATPPANRYGVHAYSEELTAYNASGNDVAFQADCAGDGTWGAIIGCIGNNIPAYLLHIGNAPGEERMFSTGTRGNVAAAAAWLAVRVNTTTYQICLHATCPST